MRFLFRADNYLINCSMNSIDITESRIVLRDDSKDNGNTYEPSNSTQNISNSDLNSGID